MLAVLRHWIRNYEAMFNVVSNDIGEEQVWPYFYSLQIKHYHYAFGEPGMFHGSGLLTPFGHASLDL